MPVANSDFLLQSFLENLQGVAGDGFQIAYQVSTGDAGTYFRSRIGVNWASWVRTDNFGCNTLAELKEALTNV